MTTIVVTNQIQWRPLNEGDCKTPMLYTLMYMYWLSRILCSDYRNVT